MEFHQLKYFVAVAEVGSFSGAAQRCNVAQPSLSQQIKKMEDELGRRLFDRLGRSIALTEAGEALLPRARRILAEMHQARDKVQEDIEHGRGNLAVGAIPTIAPYVLPGAIRSFTKAWPEANLTIREDFTARLVDALISAEIDMALLSTPIDHPGIELNVVHVEPLLVAVSQDSELAKLGRVSLDDLGDTPTILLDANHCLAQQVQDFCKAMRVQHRVVCRTNQLATLQQLVELGLGVALVPEMAARMDGSKRRVYLRVRDDEPRREIAVAHRIGRSKSFLEQRFLKCLTF